MTLVSNETEQALNRQYDVYAAAREEYRKKIEELAAEVERLRAALGILQKAMTAKKPIPMAFKKAIIEARAALEGPQDRMVKPLEEKP